MYIRNNESNILCLTSEIPYGIHPYRTPPHVGATADGAGGEGAWSGVGEGNPLWVYFHIIGYLFIYLSIHTRLSY